MFYVGKVGSVYALIEANASDSRVKFNVYSQATYTDTCCGRINMCKRVLVCFWAIMITLTFYVPGISEASVKNKLIEAVFHGDGYISCDFDGYKNTYGRHEGVDLVKYHKAPVYAAVAGIVVRAGDGAYHTVSIYDFSNNKSIIYLHFDSSVVRNGQWVNKGDLIGYQGNYGAPQGSHVHIEVRDGKRTSAAVSRNDPKLDNSNPWDYWSRVLLSETVKPSNLRISTDKNEYVVGESINFTFSADNATTRMAIPIDINGKRAEWLDVSGRSTYSYKTHTVGQYYYTLYAQNPAGEINIEYFPIRVVANIPTVPSGYRVVYPADGVYSVKTHLASDMALTVQNASTENHARVVIDRFNGRKNQQWKIQRIGNSEWYNIIDLNSGKSLDNEGGRHQNSNNVWLWPDRGRCEQWRFIDAGNGQYYIQANTASCYMLDVQNGWSNVNNPVWLYQFNKSNAQKWKLDKVSTYNNTRIKGDVNGDGEVNKKDVELLIEYVQERTNNIIVENGDVNADGKINVMDVVTLNKQIRE